MGACEDTLTQYSEINNFGGSVFLASLGVLIVEHSLSCSLSLFRGSGCSFSRKLLVEPLQR